MVSRRPFPVEVGVRHPFQEAEVEERPCPEVAGARHHHPEVAVVVGVRRYRAGAGVAGGCRFHLHSS